MMEQGEDWLQRLLDGVATGLVVHRSDGRVAVCNQAARRLLGLRHEQLADLSAELIAERFTTEDHCETRRYPALAVLENGESKQQVVLSRRTATDLRWLRASAVRVSGALAEVCVVVTLEDITEERTVKQDTERTSELLDGVLENLPVFVAKADREKLYSLFLGAGLKRMGVEPGRALGRSVDELFPGVGRYVDLALSGETVVFESTGNEDSGAWWFQNYMFPSSRDGGVMSFAIDVTDQKLAEQAVRERERTLKAILDNSPDIVARFDREHRHIYVNPAVHAATGLLPETFIGKTNAELGLDGTSWHGWHEVLGEVFSSREPRTFEFGVHTPNGLRTYQAHLVPELGAGDRVETVLALTRDITRLKNAERALRESEARYRALVEVMPQMVWTCDSEGQLQFLSPQCQRYAGVETPSSLGVVWSALAHPEDRGLLMLAWREAQSSGRNLDVECRLRQQDGSYRWFQVRARAIYENEGQISEWVGTNTDIENAKSAELALRRNKVQLELAHGLANLGSWSYDMEHGEAHWSDEMYRIFERDKAEGPPEFECFIGQIHPEDREVAALGFEYTRATGEEAQHEFRIISASGETRHVATRSSVEFGADGHPLRLYGTAQDISDAKRQEQMRAEMESQVQQMQKFESLGVLAGGIAHDFNNLLVGMLGNADLALQQLSVLVPPTASEELRGALEDIREAAREAARLSRQMLAYSGKGTFVFKPVAINRQVRAIGKLLRAAVPPRVRVLMELGEELPTIDADATQINQVIMNLVTNAVEAIGDQPGTIQVRSEVLDVSAEMLRRTYFSQGVEPGSYVCLTVQDTGCGMDPETLSRIFDPFFTTKFAGRGLGLGSVLGIVRAHRAAISVESEVDTGTVFKVFFPPGTSTEPRETLFPEVAPSDWRGRGLILFVDDEPTVRRFVKKMLIRLGFDVLMAEDGQRAIEVFAEHGAEISAVLMDLTMPRLHGDEATQRIHELNPTVPIILCSGYSERDVKDRFTDLPLSGFIQKPFEIAGLTKTLKAVLGTTSSASLEF